MQKPAGLADKRYGRDGTWVEVEVTVAASKALVHWGRRITSQRRSGAILFFFAQAPAFIIIGQKVSW